jgi:hypothetical protein
MCSGFRKIGLLAVSLLAMGFFSGCDRGLGRINLRPDPVVSLSFRYGVVNLSYVRVKKLPSSSAEDVAYVREADVVEVHESQMGTDVLEEERGYWYHVKAEGVDGWLYSGYISVYDYRSQAELAATMLKAKTGQ